MIDDLLTPECPEPDGRVLVDLPSQGGADSAHNVMVNLTGECPWCGTDATLPLVCNSCDGRAHRLHYLKVGSLTLGICDDCVISL
jgi:hypothetical protein